MVNRRDSTILPAMILRITICGMMLSTAVGCFRPAMNPLHQRVGADRVQQASLDASGRMDRIQNLLADGFYDDARSALNQAIADGLEHPRAFFMLGEVSTYQERYDEALAWLERSVQLAPRWPEPRLLQARVYMELDRLAAANRFLPPLKPYSPPSRRPARPRLDCLDQQPTGRSGRRLHRIPGT